MAGYESVGTVTALGSAVTRLSIGDRVVAEPLVLTPAFHEKELSITSSSDGLDYQAHARWLFKQDTQQLRTLATIFDYQTNASELIDTFIRLTNDTLSATKVFVRYEQ